MQVRNQPTSHAIYDQSIVTCGGVSSLSPAAAAGNSLAAAAGNFPVVVAGSYPAVAVDSSPVAGGGSCPVVAAASFLAVRSLVRTAAAAGTVPAARMGAARRTGSHSAVFLVLLPAVAYFDKVLGVDSRSNHLKRLGRGHCRHVAVSGSQGWIHVVVAQLLHQLGRPEHL